MVVLRCNYLSFQTLAFSTLALASRPVKAMRSVPTTPIIFELFTKPTFVIVIFMTMRRREMITRWARKIIVEMAILAVRVVVVVSKRMITNIVVIGQAKKMVVRILGMLNQSREFMIYVLSFMIDELFMTVEGLWIYLFVFALVLRYEKWVRVGIRIRKRRSR